MAEERTPTWEDVARIYGRKIYNFAYRLTGNPDDAADLVQEVLIRVRKGLGSYRPGSFDGWLWRITRNAFIDDVRRRQRRPADRAVDEPCQPELDRGAGSHRRGCRRRVRSRAGRFHALLW